MVTPIIIVVVVVAICVGLYFYDKSNTTPESSDDTSAPSDTVPTTGAPLAPASGLGGPGSLLALWDNKVTFSSPMSTGSTAFKWSQPVAVDFKDFAADGKSLCGVNSATQKVYCTADWTAKDAAKTYFHQPGLLRNITVSGTNVCGADARGDVNDIYCAFDFTKNKLARVTGDAVAAALSGNSICALKTNGSIFCSPDQGKSWTLLPKQPSSAVSISMNGTNGLCYLDAKGGIQCSDNTTNPTWVAANDADIANKRLGANLNGSQLCVANSRDEVWCSEKLFAATKKWFKYPGLAKQVSQSASVAPI
jgi:hypothetical protein